jgi:hypothetical protein
LPGCRRDMETVEQRNLKESHRPHPTIRARTAVAPRVRPLTNFSRRLRAPTED